MSTSILDFRLAQARQIAEKYLAELKPYCTRIEIAGSIRREKETIHDIEIVAVPVLDEQRDMFGTVTGYTSHLDREINRLAASWGAVIKKAGPKFKQLGLLEGLTLDLFLVTPPAQWGVLFTIRTGPWQFSNQMVTVKRYLTHENRPGLLPSYLKVEDGRVIHRETGAEYQTPEEQDFFDLCGIPYIKPQERK